ncbi:MAG: YihY/virulence factor BrkB family protein [Ilumatobacteraceae bacterium]
MATGNWTTHPRVVKVRSRSAAADLLVRAADNFRVHRTGRNATLVAHYGFLSVFPLLLVFTTVLGFVLESRPKLQETIIDSAFSRIPIIGQQLASNPSALKGNAIALVLGLLLALWAGMRAFNALQVALDDIADVPMDGRPNLFRTRGRSLMGIAIVGVSQIGAATLTGFIGVTGVRGLVKIGFALSAVLVNTAVLLAVYRWLCVRAQTWRQVAPGAAFAGFAFAVLQVAGTAIVGRSIAKASPVYGTFASVIGLITWLGLHSTIALLGAELNRALPARRYRPPTPAVLTPDC